jgi:signal transduction histidine kinase
MQPSSIKELVSNIIDMYSMKAKKKGIKLKFNIDEDSIPEKVFVD